EVVRPSDTIAHKTAHGTTRAFIANMITGASTGVEQNLELLGVGYRVQMQGNNIILNVAYSHPVQIPAEDGLTLSVDKNTKIKVEGISKERVGAVASYIRSIRPREPYKGKGIRYEGEYVRQKEGKTGK